MGGGEENGQGGAESSEDETQRETVPLLAGTVGSQEHTGLEGRLLTHKCYSKVEVTFDTKMAAHSTEKN